MKNYIGMIIAAILTALGVSTAMFMCLSSTIDKMFPFPRECNEIQASEESLRESEKYTREFVRATIGSVSSNLFEKLGAVNSRLDSQDNKIASFDQSFQTSFTDKVDKSLADSYTKYQQMTIGIVESYATKQQAIEKDLAKVRSDINETMVAVDSLRNSNVTNILAEIEVLEKNILDLENKLNANTGRDAGIDERILALEKGLREIRVGKVQPAPQKAKASKKQPTQP